MKGAIDWVFMSQANIPVRLVLKRKLEFPALTIQGESQCFDISYYGGLTWLCFPMGRISTVNKVCDSSCKPFYYHGHLSCRFGCFRLWSFILSLLPKITRAQLALAPHGGTDDFSSFSNSSPADLPLTLGDSSLAKVMEMWPGHREDRVWLWRSILRGKHWDGHFRTHFISS